MHSGSATYCQLKGGALTVGFPSISQLRRLSMYGSSTRLRADAVGVDLRGSTRRKSDKSSCALWLVATVRLLKKDMSTPVRGIKITTRKADVADGPSLSYWHALPITVESAEPSSSQKSSLDACE